MKAIDAKKLIPDKPILSINSDGYHYTRIIGNEPHEKIMVGNIANLPIKNLEESVDEIK